MKHQLGKWYPETDKPVPEDGDTFVLCVSGKDGNVTYDRAIIASDSNGYENGRWYINGVFKPLTVIGWYIVPDCDLKE